ncbi:precorrin-3B synthase [Mycobacterium sp. MYCO198283]|uniref:precorrin-3B synthase n=1 Tax=Mycobacterium sp. MYCO198283 TaxID=2883505 RepID=UPI001E4560AB|nr:precorrin-3B synthase [Mycobacterium sp. MYCO198283]MCG5433389.1 precorrin-3B synthase [Mycobacterium sp. MYCO198283]
MTRDRADDACPGALQLHPAADGALARIRLPGGRLDAAQLEALAHTARDLGGGALELTARANLQIRGIADADTAAVADAVAAAGLLPSPTHERVRNIVASPLTGRAGGLVDLRPALTALDAAIAATPELAGLTGRFFFGLDDGRGDVAGMAPDVGALAVAADAIALLLGGRDTGIRVPPTEVVALLVEIAVTFAGQRGSAWRVAELPDPEGLLPDRPRTAPVADTAFPVPRPPIGWIAQDDGRIALGAGVPLGVLDARLAEFVTAVGAPVIVTPWRSLLICDLTEDVADTVLRVLAPMGLIFDENAPLLRVSACTGSPGCEKSAADVRADAVAAAAAAGPAAPAVHRHFVGCERACGSPPGGEVWVATGDAGVYRPRSRDLLG